MERYTSAGIDVQQRVMLLFYFLLIAVILLAGLVAMNIVLAKDAGVIGITIILAAIMAAAVVALGFTVRGRYFVGADMAAMASTLAISALTFTVEMGRDPTYVTNFYFYPVVILLSALFCRFRWTLIATLILGATAAGSFFLSAGIGVGQDFGHFLEESLMDFSFALVFVFVLSFLIIRVNARVTAQAVAEGEKNRRQYAQLQDAFATLRLTSRELAQASEAMSQSLATFAEDTQSEAASTEQVSATIEQMSGGIETIAASASDQHRKVASLVKSLEELSAGIASISGETAEAARLSEEILARARGSEESLGAINGRMSRIVRSSEDLDGIIGIIRGISDQTNLLALNASIEAARAGEAGRGFAVVAQEVSKLAEQTAQSLTQIDSIVKGNTSEIHGGREQIESVVSVMQEVVEGVTRMGGFVTDFAAVVTRQVETNAVVDRSSRDVMEISSSIDRALGEQRAAVSEIAKSIALINERIQSSTEAAEAMASRSSGIVVLATGLKGKMEGGSRKQPGFP
jgi:methyl-accepting chemotaxis protein